MDQLLIKLKLKSIFERIKNLIINLKIRSVGCGIYKHQLSEIKKRKIRISRRIKLKKYKFIRTKSKEKTYRN